MALDGAFLSLVKKEIEDKAVGAKIDKIYQPSKEEIVIGLRGKGSAEKLLISAGANSPRIHFTKQAPENPMVPPMFCMLMRKMFGGARLLGVRQQGLDRILYLDFETTNELGDTITLTLAVEIMGRHSNIIVLNNEGKIIDAVKRINEEMSSVRQVLPGMRYELPPSPQKLRLTEASATEIIEAIKNYKPCELSKALLGVLEGVSPILCREIAYYASRGIEIQTSELFGDRIDRLSFALKNVSSTLINNTGKPTMVLDQNKPKDMSFIEINQYGHLLVTKSYETYSELLDSFYVERDIVERMKQKSHDLLKFLLNTVERLTRKIAAQTEELKECDNREQLKIYGDLLSSNLYSLEKGMTSVKLFNYYDEAMPEIEIKLDPAKTPVQNAQQYYSEYRKAATAEQMLKEQILQAKDELEYIESVFDALSRAVTENELNQIREELIAGGYLKAKGKKAQKQQKLEPLKYQTTDGFTVLTGRNNIQNDKLTMKDSKNYDVWFHVKNIPGSHTILVTDGKDPTNLALEEAACIAAYNSKARNSALVPVDYTIIKNVKKPAKAKPGMVIYENFKTAYVTPNEEKVKNMSFSNRADKN